MSGERRTPFDVLEAYFGPHSLGAVDEALRIVDECEAALSGGRPPTPERLSDMRSMLRELERLFAGARASYRIHRVEHRAAKRVSSTSLPAVAGAAMQLEQAQNIRAEETKLRREGDAAIVRALQSLGAVSRNREQLPDPEEP